MTFIQRLADGVVRGDGSMGYVLVREGVPRDRSFDFLNIDRSELVASVHRQYLEAGDVDVIQTNTFGANRLHLATFGRGHEKFVDVINREGVALARQAAEGTRALVAGSVGPLTHVAGDALHARPGDIGLIRATYEEQIRALGVAGVDLFIIETVHSYQEGIAALEIAREAFSEVPVLFLASSSRRGETAAGDDIETLIRAADERGATGLGLNCILDPAEMYDQILELGEWTNKPLAVQPNVGKRGVLCQGIFEAERSLETAVRTYARRFVDAGVRYIGGCCGIDPRHIGRIRDHLKDLSPEAVEQAAERRRERYQRARRIVFGPGGAETKPSCLEQALRSGDEDPERRPVLIEVDPPKLGESPERALAGAELLFEAGLRFITIADNPGRVPRLDRFVFARMLAERVPEAKLIIHVSCADRTLVNFATELESLHYFSRDVLVITGDPPSGEYSRSSAPYDLRSVTAIRAFARRNHGIALDGRDDLAPTDYFIGGALNPRALDSQLAKFWTKAADAGASYALTQPLFDRETLSALHAGSQRFRERLKTERDRAGWILPGVMCIASARNARILRKEFGMPVPKALIAELEELPTRKAQRRRGREIFREMMLEARAPLPFPGLYVVPQFHHYKSCIADLKETGWLR